MVKFNHFAASIPGLVCTLLASTNATAEESACDKVILDRPACEVGDFDRTQYDRPAKGPLLHGGQQYETITTKREKTEFLKPPGAPKAIKDKPELQER